MALIYQLFYYVVDKKFLYQTFATLLVFTIIRLYLLIKIRQKRFKLLSYYNIHGPERDLISGNFNLYRQHPASYVTDEYCLKRFGKTYGVYIGDEAAIITTDLEVLKKVFFEYTNSFKARTKTFLQTPLSHSILFAPYHRWVVMRKVMSPLFSSYQMRGADSVQFIEDSIRFMLDYIAEKVKSRSREQGSDGFKIVLDIHDLMKATALHMISSMAIRLPNVEVKENEENVRSLDSFLSKSDKGVVEYAIKCPFIKPVLSFISTNFEYDKTIALIHRGLNKTIDEELRLLSETKAEQGGKDKSKKSGEQLLDLLIRLHHAGKLTREEVLANADAVLFAGYDTTSTTLTYIFWVLGKHQKIQEQLRQDLMTYGTESAYLEQVINETMRLYPTVNTFTTRLATETVEINDLTIPQGTKVIYNSWLIHRNPEIWPNPTEFDPDRFKAGQDIHPCAFAPFGLSDRKCLGYQLAKLEMKMITCDILLRYKIGIVSPNELELNSFAYVLTKPREKVILEIEKI